MGNKIGKKWFGFDWCLMAVLVIVSNGAIALPLCVNVGTEKEGWALQDGFVVADQCSAKVVYCQTSDSNEENWYTAKPIERKLLGYANCAEFYGTQPNCILVGTPDEGWATPGRLLHDQCAEKVAVCGAIGTRSEGWFATSIDKSTVQKLAPGPCFQE